MNISKEKIEPMIDFLEKFTGVKLESQQKKFLEIMLLNGNTKLIMPRQSQKRAVYITR